MNKLLTTITLLCFSVAFGSQVKAQSDQAILFDFVKQQDPDFLPYFVTQTDDCPSTQAAAEEVIEGVIIRSRVRTAVRDIGYPDLYINVGLTCIESQSGAIAIALEVYFGKYPMLLGGGITNYSQILLGSSSDRQNFLGSIRISIEEAMTDYVEANFLLDSN